MKNKENWKLKIEKYEKKRLLYYILIYYIAKINVKMKKKNRKINENKFMKGKHRL